MSKKKPAKKKAATKAAPTKSPAKRKAPAKKSSPARRAKASRASAEIGKRNNIATIFLYKIDGNYRIRTSPQLISAAPGFIEWTVVNLASDEEVDVEITWPEGGPWGSEPVRIRKGNERKSLADAKPGRYKYNVTANGYTEDPEVEFPEGM